MKYPLAALEAVAKVVDDPETAAEVMQELDAAGYILATKPTGEVQNEARISRLVGRIIFLDQLVADDVRHTKTTGFRMGEASALRYLLECLGVALNEPADYMYWIDKMGKEKRRRGADSIIRFQDENAAALWPSTKRDKAHEAAAVRTVAGSDRYRRSSGVTEAFRRV